jgi:hypothetical protein
MDALEKDELAFQRELPNLLDEAGKFAVVFEEKLLGVFASYDAALRKGYEAAGLKPFLVEQITKIPQVQQFTRSVGFECLT